MKTVVMLVLLFMWNGEVKLEKHPYNTSEECQEAGSKKTEELVNDPRFEGAFGAWCAKVKVSEAGNK